MHAHDRTMPEPARPRRPAPEPVTGAGEGVDRPIERKWWAPRRVALAVVALALAAAVVAAVFTDDAARRRVDWDGLTIGTVERLPFQEYVTVAGTVLPRKSVYLDIVEGGRVEEIHVREGALVERGQPLVRLSNNDLQLRLVNADMQRVEQVNRLEDIRSRMEQTEAQLQQELALLDYEIRRLEIVYDRQRRLYEQQLVTAQEFEQLTAELEHFRRRRALTVENQRQSSARARRQITQIERSLASMEANYGVIRQILDNLVVRAPARGRLTGLEAEVGELRASGSRLGQIDVLDDGYKVRAAIDEFYISRVARDQPATAELGGGATHRMTVARVYPEVRDGRFEVDLEFADGAPADLRRGQTIRFRLELGDSREALVVPRGAFFQTTGGRWAYVLDGDGAVRRPIRLGRQNPEYFEVLGGLAAGDRVVVSSYEEFAEARRLAPR